MSTCSISVLSLLGKLTGKWEFRFTGMPFVVKFFGGKVKVGGRTLTPMPSDKMSYDLKLNFRQLNFYIKFNPTGFPTVVAFKNNGQQVPGTVNEVVGGGGGDGGIPSNSKCSVAYLLFHMQN